MIHPGLRLLLKDCDTRTIPNQLQKHLGWAFGQKLQEHSSWYPEEKNACGCEDIFYTRVRWIFIVTDIDYPQCPELSINTWMASSFHTSYSSEATLQASVQQWQMRSFHSYFIWWCLAGGAAPVSLSVSGRIRAFVQFYFDPWYWFHFSRHPREPPYKLFWKWKLIGMYRQ